jgi:hypothetical protein
VTHGWALIQVGVLLIVAGVILVFLEKIGRLASDGTARMIGSRIGGHGHAITSPF